MNVSGVLSFYTVSLPWRHVMLAVCILSLLCSTGCTRTRTERGIEPIWQTLEASSLVSGVTTKGDILERLGPPSQVITHDRGEVFYYLHEEAQTRGLVLLVYNRSQTDTRYDRAIFFFDAQGTLNDYAISGAREGAP